MKVIRATQMGLVAMWVLATSPIYASQPGESVVLDPSTGNYTVTYCSIGPVDAKNSCALTTATYVPATKLSAQLFVGLSIGANWVVAYSYRVANLPASVQPLISFGIDPVIGVSGADTLPPRGTVQSSGNVSAFTTVAQNAMSAPAGWERYLAYSDAGAGLRVSWLFSNITGPSQGLLPGQRQIGFGVKSSALPGIGPVEIAGNSGRPMTYVDEGPTGDIETQVDALDAHDYLSPLAAVPHIAVPVPFDRAELLRRIDAEASSWVGLKLLDPALFAQLDQWLQAAIAAADRKDLPTCGLNVASLVKRIHDFHASLEDVPTNWTGSSPSSLIDRRAAQVLVFDLAYALAHP